MEKEKSRAEIRGSLSPQYWGAGVALEAVEAILDYGFQDLQLKSIEAHRDSRNRSARYLLELFGFVKEGHFRDRFCFEGVFHDLESWILFRDNFDARSRRE